MVDLSRYLPRPFFMDYPSPADGETDGFNPLSLLASTPIPLAAAPPQYSFGGAAPQQAMSVAGGDGLAGPTQPGVLDYLNNLPSPNTIRQLGDAYNWLVGPGGSPGVGITKAGNIGTFTSEAALEGSGGLFPNANQIAGAGLDPFGGATGLGAIPAADLGPTAGLAGGGLDAFGGGTGLGAGIPESGAAAGELAGAGSLTAAAPFLGSLGIILAGIAMAEMDESEAAGASIGLTPGGGFDFGAPRASGRLAERGPALEAAYRAYQDALGQAYTGPLPSWVPETFGFSMATTQDPNWINVGFGAGQFPWAIYSGTDPAAAAAATAGLLQNPDFTATQGYVSQGGDTQFDTTYDLATALGQPTGQISIDGIGGLTLADKLAAEAYAAQTGRGDAPLWYLARSVNYQDTGH